MIEYVLLMEIYLMKCEIILEDKFRVFDFKSGMLS